jgi:hypothetical protein
MPRWNHVSATHNVDSEWEKPYCYFGFKPLRAIYSTVSAQPDSAVSLLILSFTLVKSWLVALPDIYPPGTPPVEEMPVPL